MFKVRDEVYIVKSDETTRYCKKFGTNINEKHIIKDINKNRHYLVLINKDLGSSFFFEEIALAKVADSPLYRAIYG